jgi:adenylate cyclase
MSITPDQDNASEPEETPSFATAVRKQRDQIIVSPGFGKGSRLAQILDYVIEEELEGRGDRIKAYAIAQGPLGRSSDFDPSTDSIVRVEMARLRTALKLFYADATDAAVMIDIPKGSYRPQLSLLASKQGTGRNTADSVVPSSVRSRWPRPRIVVIALALALCAFALTFAWLKRDTAEPMPPLVLVAPVTISSPDPVLRSFERGLKGELVAALSRYRWLSVAYRSDADLATIGTARSIFVVNMNVVIEGRSYSSVTTLQNAATGEVRWRYGDKGELAENEVFPTLAGAARSVATEIARPLGTITRGEIETVSTRGESKGIYPCLLRFRAFRIDWTASNAEAFQRCAQAVKAAPDDAYALALRAHALIDSATTMPSGNRASLLEQARSASEAALKLNSDMDLAMSSALLARLCQRDSAAVARMTDTMLERRGNDPGALMDLAVMTALVLDDRERASALEATSRSLAIANAAVFDVVGLLEQFQQGEFARLAARAPIEGEHRLAGLIIAFAATGEAGDARAAASIVSSLRGAGSFSAKALKDRFEGACWADRIKDMLRPGIDKAVALSL